jgi:hypothetical protein
MQKDTVLATGNVTELQSFRFVTCLDTGTRLPQSGKLAVVYIRNPATEDRPHTNV